MLLSTGKKRRRKEKWRQREGRKLTKLIPNLMTLLTITPTIINTTTTLIHPSVSCQLFSSSEKHLVMIGNDKGHGRSISATRWSLRSAVTNSILFKQPVPRLVSEPGTDFK